MRDRRRIAWQVEPVASLDRTIAKPAGRVAVAARRLATREGLAECLERQQVTMRLIEELARERGEVPARVVGGPSVVLDARELTVRIDQHVGVAFGGEPGGREHEM